MKNRNNLSNLREHLYDVIERLKEGNDPESDPKDCIDIPRANAINKAAQQIINSSKVELEALKLLTDEDIYKSEIINSGLLTETSD